MSVFQSNFPQPATNCSTSDCGCSDTNSDNPNTYPLTCIETDSPIVTQAVSYRSIFDVMEKFPALFNLIQGYGVLYDYITPDTFNGPFFFNSREGNLYMWYPFEESYKLPQNVTNLPIDITHFIEIRNSMKEFLSTGNDAFMKIAFDRYDSNCPSGIMIMQKDYLPTEFVDQYPYDAYSVVNSDETPSTNAILWFQPDTGNLLKSVNGAWV